MQQDYLTGPSPLIFAHRGLALTAPENTAAAFQAALDCGASHIESDVRLSRDGIPVLYHDPDMARVGGQAAAIAELDFAELAATDLGDGNPVLSLDEALSRFPTARFNLDIKSADAAEPSAAVIRNHAAQHRVLLTSFSAARRKKTMAALSESSAGSPAEPTPVTSPAALEMLSAVLLLKIGLVPAARTILASFGAVQIPERILGMGTASRRMIDRFHRCGVQVHFWTINDPERMAELVNNGADGIVTDRADLAVQLFRG